MGIVLTVIVHQAQRTPAILAGLLVAFVIMTIGFYMIAAAFAESALGQLAWAQIFVANLLAAGLMGGYMWRRHPDAESTAQAGARGNRRLGRRRLPVHLRARGRVLAARVPLEEHHRHDDRRRTGRPGST